MKKVILFLTLVILLPLVIADVNVGTSEGYIFDTDGNFVGGALVRATVNSCVVQCIQETTSESTGYYVVANLNLPKNEDLTVYAEKDTPLGLESGFSIGTANEFQAASINVTICLPPSKPVLVKEPNTHDTDVRLEWTSTSDKKGYSTYDEYVFDANAPIIDNGAGSKSMDESDLPFTVHSWRVRTCNPFCCSGWSRNSFNVGNLPPSKPNLTDQLDIAPGPVSLSWISGIDPDGDETKDEYEFGVIKGLNRSTIDDAESPQEEDTFGINYYLWRVRTCEVESEQLCSDWSEDGFVVCGNSAPECRSPSGGGTRIVEVEKSKFGSVSQSLTIISPENVEQELELPISVRYTSLVYSKNLLFKIHSNQFNFNDFLIAELENKTAQFEMLGKQKENLEKGNYNLTFEVYSGNKRISTDTFDVQVTAPLRITIRRAFTKNKFPLLIFIVILLICSLIYHLFRRRLDKRSKKKKTKPNKHFNMYKGQGQIIQRK